MKQEYGWSCKVKGALVHLVALAAGCHFNLIHYKTFPCTPLHSAPLKIEMGQFISNKRWTLYTTFSLNTSYLLIYHHQSLSRLSRICAHMWKRIPNVSNFHIIQMCQALYASFAQPDFPICPKRSSGKKRPQKYLSSQQNFHLKLHVLSNWAWLSD